MENVSNSIFDKITYIVLQAEKYKNLSGQNKKLFVIEKLKQTVSDEFFETYFDMISDFIEFLIKSSKNKKFLKHINTKSKGIINGCFA
tara:strand:- start:52 stop:315 length:264 start_codon:yes stop_codon:yes gene_type:complete